MQRSISSVMAFCISINSCTILQLLAQVFLTMNTTMDIEDCDIKMDFDDTRIPLETTNARGYRIELDYS